MICSACKRNQAERHHIKSRGSGGTDISENILMLCRECHQFIHMSGRSKFIDKFPHVWKILKDKGWMKDDYGKWFLNMDWIKDEQEAKGFLE